MDLLRTARGSGRIACHVPTSGFDDLLLRLSFHCLSGDLLKRAQGIASGAARGAVPESTPFTLELFPLGGIVKSNAFPIQCPSDVLQFEVADLPERGAWKYLKETTDGSDIIAGPFGGKVLALGTVDAIQDAFGDRLRSSIVRAPIDQKDLAYEDGVVVSILRRALIRYCEKKLGLRSDGKGLVWDGSPSETKWVGGKKHAIHQAALLSLRAIGREQFLVLKPSLVVADEHGDRLPEESILPIKLQILGYQHNSRFNDAANAWRDRLFPDPQNTWEFPPDCGSAFRFRIKRGPLFAAIGDPARKGPINVAPAVEQHLTQRGVQLEEPPLVFTRKTGGGTVKDFHPIRGVVQNRPFDYSLTLGGAVAAHLRWYCLPGNRGQDIRVLSRRIAAPEGSTTNRA